MPPELRLVRGFLKLRILGFSGLKDQFDAKKANFGGLTAKIVFFQAYFDFYNPPMAHFDVRLSPPSRPLAKS